MSIANDILLFFQARFLLIIKFARFTNGNCIPIGFSTERPDVWRQGMPQLLQSGANKATARGAKHRIEYRVSLNQQKD